MILGEKAVIVEGEVGEGVFPLHGRNTDDGGAAADHQDDQKRHQKKQEEPEIRNGDDGVAPGPSVEPAAEASRGPGGGKPKA